MTASVLPLLSAAASASAGPPAWMQFLPIIGMVALMWFLFLRPQMQQQKSQKAKLDAIKKGDMVVTGGGLLGKVTKVEDDQLELELAPGMRVRALRATISDIVQPGGSKPAND